MLKRFSTGFLAGVIVTAIIMLSAPGFAEALYTIGNRSLTMKVNGRVIQADPPPLLINDRTYVPIRFVAEAMQMTVGWDDKTSTVSIENRLPGAFYGKVTYTVEGKTYPDHLAKVYLFPPVGDPVIQETTVAGIFDFGEIEGDEYTVVVVSGNMKGTHSPAVSSFLSSRGYVIPEGKASMISYVNLFENKKLSQEYAFSDTTMDVKVPSHPISSAKDGTPAKLDVQIYTLTLTESIPQVGAKVYLFPQPPTVKWTDTKELTSFVTDFVTDDEGWVREEVPAGTYRVLLVSSDITLAEHYDYMGWEEAKVMAFLSEYFANPQTARDELGNGMAMRVADAIDTFTQKTVFTRYGFVRR